MASLADRTGVPELDEQVGTRVIMTSSIWQYGTRVVQTSRTRGELDRHGPSETEFWNAHALRSKAHLNPPTLECMTNPFLRACDERFLQTIGATQSTTMLEVGCGMGDLSLFMAQRGGHVVGLDIADMMVKRSRTRGSAFGINAEFVLGDAQHLPFGDSTLDMVVGMRAMHHFQDTRQFLTEVRRVLRPGGRAVFIEPQKNNPIVEVNRKVLRQDFHTKGEHPLVEADIRVASSLFGGVTRENFYLLSPLAYVFKFLLPIDSAYARSTEWLQRLDGWFAGLTPLRRFYWQVILTLEKTA